MQSTFTLTKDDLNLDFLNKLKKFFANDVTSVTVKVNTTKNKISELPNAETIAAMKESRELIASGEKGTTDIDAFFAELES